MRWSELRTQLLPKSGVRVVAPWLMIAPPGNPIIRLDLRVLDRIEVQQHDASDESDESEDPATRDHDRRCHVVLACGDLEVALYIADGPEAVERIVREAAPLTREQAGTERSMPIEHIDYAIPKSETSDPVLVSHGRLSVLSSKHPDDPAVELDQFAGRELELTRPNTTVGRTDESDIVIDHGSISRNHASVSRDPETGRYTISDLQSTNGVRVNGQDCVTAELGHDDIVDLGHVRMRFVDPVDDCVEHAMPPDAEHMLTVGRHVVVHRGEFIQVGPVAFRLNEVEEYALCGANLPLPHGCLLQAALVLVVVAAADRDAAWLGIQFDPAHPRITAMILGCPGDKAGLRPGDELVSVGGVAVTSSAQFATTIRQHTIGNRVMLRVRRNSDLVDLEVILEAWQKALDALIVALHHGQAPEIAATTPEVDPLRDLTAHPVLDFWSTWCRTSNVSMPLSAIHDKYPDLRIVGVSIDGIDDLEHAMSNSTRYLRLSDRDDSIPRSLVEPVPMFVVIHKDEAVRKIEVGVGNFEAFEAALVQLLK